MLVSKYADHVRLYRHFDNPSVIRLQSFIKYAIWFAYMASLALLPASVGTMGRSIRSAHFRMASIDLRASSRQDARVPRTRSKYAQWLSTCLVVTISNGTIGDGDAVGMATTVAKTKLP